MVLATVWFLLWGLLWAVYFITDGYDLGIGSLMPFLGKTEERKRVMINVIGPVWDGNEVWLLTAGGVTFAAFPLTYAVLFSAFYTPLMLLLFALIFRGVAFEYRSKGRQSAMADALGFVHLFGEPAAGHTGGRGFCQYIPGRAH